MDRRKVQEAIDAGRGILRLEPCWVPRSFMIPGRRLKRHPDDLYAFGGHRGGINERWFSSTTKASNGPDTLPDEGLSYVRPKTGDKFLLKEAVETAGDLLLGADVMEREKGWNLLCKFFDNMGPIPHHMHRATPSPSSSDRRESPKPITFLRNTTRSRTISPTPTWAWSRVPRKQISAAAWKNGTRATTEFSSTRAPTVSNPAQDGRSTPASSMLPGR